MNFEKMVGDMLPAIEDQLKLVISTAVSEENCSELAKMLRYHLGWEGERAGREAQGKRIRPLLVLLCCTAAGSDWKTALPAASAVELLHNFSLIHDDIQDQSLERHGRPTIWAKWGIAQAINAGDLMFTLAYNSLLALKADKNEAVIIQATEILHHTSISLTKGQFLDLTYEKEKTIPLEAYWPMIAGKTAALLAASCELGGLAAGIFPEKVKAFRDFGYRLGLAFQVQDDWLGIWGDISSTGKSNESDLVNGKKSLPVLYAINLNKTFSERWKKGKIEPDEVAELAKLMVDEGAEKYTRETAHRLISESLQALERTGGNGEGMIALRELTSMLLTRVK
jgi:geranylgeranyl diphosphate synthase, type I